MNFPKMSNDLSRVNIPSCVQPKLDWECVIWTGEKLVNRFGRERYLPLCDRLPKSLQLAGELYWGDGKRNFYDALSHLKTDDPLLKFAIFSLYNVDMPFSEQIRVLSLLSISPNISVVQGMNAYSHLEVEHYCEFYLKEGFEGAVIKPLGSKDPRNWIKFKPDETIDLLIMGVSKKHSAIAVGTPELGIIGPCSLVGHNALAERIGKYKIIDETKEDYLIHPEIVVECLHLGIIQPSGSLRSPRLSRVREDLGVKDL
jgi:hypothetical protein